MRRAYAPGLSSVAAVLASTALVIASCTSKPGGDVAGAAGDGGGGDAGSAGAAGDAGSAGSGGDAGSAGATGGDSGGTGGFALGGAGGTGGGAGSSGGSAGGSAGSGDQSGGSGGAAGIGGAAGMGSGTCAGDAATLYDVAVNLADLRQKISGFGASTAWGSTMSAADADTLWSTTTGAGLSLHRIRIDYTNGRTSELDIAKLAVARGVTVWASPWTPPVADKSNNNSVGGTLTDGQAFATFLTGFVSYMHGQGVDIFAVSAQNEPDANVTYESCSYTGATMDSFITGYMGPAFANSGVKIMGPETQNWCGFQNFEPTLVNNPYIDIIATHEYGCSPRAYPEIAQAGKEFWQTEIYDSNNTADAGMGSALRVARLIHDAMTIASMNAWHYWWVYPATNDNGALWDKSSNAPSKRLWVEGNFARFVRPGFQRVGATGAVPAGVLLSAYTNPADGTVAVVAINNNSSATAVSLFVSGAAPCRLMPWVTSAGDSLASKSAVSISGGRGTVMLDPQSVTTLVGRP